MMRCSGGVRARHRKQLVEGRDGCGREAVEGQEEGRTERGGQEGIGGQRDREDERRDGSGWQGGAVGGGQGGQETAVAKRWGADVFEGGGGRERAVRGGEEAARGERHPNLLIGYRGMRCGSS